MVELNEVTVLQDLTSREQTVSELQSSGTFNIHFSDTIRSSRQKEILQSLLLNIWLLPSKEHANRIPAKGKTERLVTSTTVPITGSDSFIERLNLVIKKMTSLAAALREQKNLVKLHQRTTIRAIHPLAVMTTGTKTNSNHCVLTLLEKGVIPIDNLRLEEFSSGQKADFLNELAMFTADAGNQGVSHSDLSRLSNIGYDVTQSAPKKSEFLFFDLESANILESKIVRRMKDLSWKPSIPTLMEFSRYQYVFLNDAIDVTVALIKRLGVKMVRDEYAQIYLDLRDKALGQSPQEYNSDYVVKAAQERFALVTS